MIYPDLPKLALSIRHPWVWCLLTQGKNIENRSWRTNMRGPICLHAAKGMKDSEFTACLDFVDEILPTADTIDGHRDQVARLNAAYAATMHHNRGGIVATADIVDCVTDHPSPWFFGPYGFVLANIQPVPIIQVRGLQQFFDWRRQLGKS